MANVSKMKRDQRLEARLTQKQKRILEKAAALRGTTLTNFVVTAAERAAEEILERDQIVKLSESDQKRFFDALTNPPKPNKQMKEAFELHRKLIRQE